MVSSNGKQNFITIELYGTSWQLVMKRWGPERQVTIRTSVGDSQDNPQFYQMYDF